jgi:hypothetical protein
VGEGVDIAVAAILRVLPFSLDSPVGPESLSWKVCVSVFLAGRVQAGLDIYHVLFVEYPPG